MTTRATADNSTDIAVLATSGKYAMIAKIQVSIKNRTDYKADFAHAPHARCFMNKNIFAYLAVRAGFRVLDQKIIDWYDKSNLDCISLLEK